MDYFEVRHEDRQNLVNWIANHKYDFMCKVCDRISYAVKNDLPKVKLFVETIDGIRLRKVNIYLKELKGGSFIKNTLKYFQDLEDYERCHKLKECLKYLKKKDD